MTKKANSENSICRALIQSGGDGFDFEAVATPTDNKQLMYSRSNDEYFYQVLRTGADNVLAQRLDSGLPLFDNHEWDKSASRVLGITTGYEFTGDGLVIRAKFGARADEALKQDVKDGIVKTVSIEGHVIRYSIERNPGQVPIYYAEEWEPTSLSFAPVPNDISAQIEVKRALADQISKSAQKPESDNSIYVTLKEKF